jgi:MFS family permease
MTDELTDRVGTTVKRVTGLGPFILGFVGIQLFTNMANGGIGGLLIPNRIAVLDPQNKVALPAAHRPERHDRDRLPRHRRVRHRAYLAVDQALMTQVLPSNLDTGKDLSILNIAQSGGQVLAPVAASIVTKIAGYPGLYVFAGLLAVLSAVAVLPIKSVR